MRERDDEWLRDLESHGAVPEPEDTDEKTSVIQIAGLIDGTETAFDGQWVVEYDPGRQGREPGTGRLMRCHLVTTAELDKATRYTKLEAMDLWRAVDPQHPVRSDGKPNRPLTAFSVMIGPPDDQISSLIQDVLGPGKRD